MQFSDRDLLMIPKALGLITNTAKAKEKQETSKTREEK
jgi:hypothetical protein